MKKIYALLLAGIMCWSLAACGGETTQTPAEETAPEEQDAVVSEDAAVSDGAEETQDAEQTEASTDSAAETPDFDIPEGIDADAIKQVMSYCVGYADAAGSSLRNAQAAYILLRYAHENALSGLDDDGMMELRSAIWEAYQSMTDEEKAEFDRNFAEEISALLNDATEEYDSVQGLFDDAGLDAAMSALVSEDNVLEDWSMLRGNIILKASAANG